MYRVRFYILLLAVFVTGCATLPKDYPRTPSVALQDTQASRLGSDIAPLLLAHPNESGFYLLSSGVDAFVARMLLATNADRSIDLQYYLFHDDTSGQLLTARLIQAADRGVRVRLLLDDIDTAGKDGELAALDAHPNIEVRLFNPFAEREHRYVEFVTRFGEVSRRMHNKSYIVDNQVAIVGGRNIGDQYFERDQELTFGDLDLLSIGPIVHDVSTAFDLYWNHHLAVPLAAMVKGGAVAALAALRQRLKQAAQGQRQSDYRGQVEQSGLLAEIREQRLRLYWGAGRVLYDDPEKLDVAEGNPATSLLPQLRAITDGVHEELLIFSPYFVPTEGGVEVFAGYERAGVAVKVLTNSLAANDVPAVHAGYRRYRVPLLEAGVELYELKPVQQGKRLLGGGGLYGSSRSSLHAKSMIIDRRRLFIGSFNLDPRSIYLNTEMGILVESEPLARDLATWLDTNLASAAYRLALKGESEGGTSLVWVEQRADREVVYNDEPEAGWWRRLQVFFYSILPIEDQL